MFTQQQMVTGQPQPVRPPRRRHRIWAVPLAVIGLLPMLAVIVSSFIPATALIDKRDCVSATQDADGSVRCERYGPEEAVEFAVVPAAASPAGSRLQVSGLKQYDATNQILFVTVRQPAIQLFEWFVAEQWKWSDEPNPGLTDFYSYTDVYGNVTPEEDREIGFRAMGDAKRDAYYVGLTVLGYDTELIPGPAVIQSFACYAQDDSGKCTERPPSYDVLQVNDVFTSIDGEPVAVPDDIGPLIGAHEPGDTVTITVTRDDQPVTVDVTLIADPDDPTLPRIGIQTVGAYTIELPEDVEINFATEGIGGPSAGLSFTLTLIDELSEGDLTGGQRVAVTGTMNVDGTVGAIGGLRSKASAVRQAGAKYFIVPRNQGEEDIAAARKAAGPGVTVVPVGTIDEALQALEELGGDPFVQPVEATADTPAPSDDPTPPPTTSNAPTTTG